MHLWDVFGQVPNSGNVFNVPKYQSLKIGEGTGTFTLTGTSTEIKLTYPDGTKASDYSALVAQITPKELMAHILISILVLLMRMVGA